MMSGSRAVALATLSLGLSEIVAQEDMSWVRHPGGTAAAAAASPFSTCSLGSSSCALAALTGPTLIYPGGDTRCLNGDAYAFLVTPGAPEKLLFYLEGGGACWQAGAVVLLCTASLSGAIAWSGFGVGLQNFSDPRNDYKGYTVVEALYCSGDTFVGNATLLNGGTVLYQNGYNQMSAVLAWAKANVAPRLHRLVVAGYSAGALGIMSWAQTVLRTFRFKTAGVLLDSYVGLFPPNKTSPIIAQRWGYCGTPLNVFGAACSAGDFDFPEALIRAMKAFPGVAFGSLQSKADSVQISFYQAVALSFGLQSDAQITAEQFYAGANDIMARWSRQPNYIAYVVNGTQHSFTPRPTYFDASTAGPTAPPPWGTPPMYEWASCLLREVGGFAQCDGPVKPNTNAMNLTFCDKRVARKALFATWWFNWLR